MDDVLYGTWASPRRDVGVPQNIERYVGFFQQVWGVDRDTGPFHPSVGSLPHMYGCEPGFAGIGAMYLFVGSGIVPAAAIGEDDLSLVRGIRVGRSNGHDVGVIDDLAQVTQSTFQVIRRWLGF